MRQLLPVAADPVATAPPDRLAAARAVADVLIAGERTVDLCAALHLLGRAGYSHAQLAAADLFLRLRRAA